jgi:DNA-binding NarL/FixJ family response regulator
MMNAQPIKVLVIHSNPIAKAGLTAGFRRYGDFELVNEDEQAGPAEHARADVVVTDYDAGMALIDRCRTPQSSRAQSKVMIVTPSDRESDVRHALERGARGYMLLDSEFDDLAHGVREVHMGVRALSRRIAQQLAESITGNQLTSRETEVLGLVVDGMGNKLIARRMNIAVGTVKSHLKSIFDKLHVESRTQAIAVSVRRGLLSEH